MIPGYLLFLIAVTVITFLMGTGVARARARTRIERIVTRAEELIKEGKREEAVMLLDELIREGPAVPERERGLLVLGRTLEKLDRRLEAQRAYQLYLQDFETSGDAESVALVTQRLGNLMAGPHGLSPWKQFLRDAEEQGKTAEDKAYGLIDARHMLEQGRFEEALEVLLRLARHPSHADFEGREAAQLYLGLTYEGMHRHREASDTYRQYRRQFVETPEVGHDPEIRALVDARLRVLTEDGPAATRLPWEVFKEELAQARERVPLDGISAAAPAASRTEATAPVGEPARPDASPEELAADLEQLAAGKKLGPYVLAEKLGEGGFGEVFRALLPVAIKFARTPAEVDRLKRLAELQERVDSPRIVKPLEVDLEAEPPHVVLEYVDGTTLRALLADGPLPAELALGVFREIALGLADAHRVGVAHLDLKPENVLLDTDGTLKLTDFDLAIPDGKEGLHASLDFRTEAGPQGTLAYMSPEQRAGKPVDVRSDVYTFGVCLFEALTGTLPEPGDKPSDFVEGLSPEIDALFERCYARQERRFAHAGELVAALEDAGLEAVDRAELAARFAALPRQRRSETLPRALADTVIEPAPVSLVPPEAAVRTTRPEEEPAEEEPAEEEPAPEEPAAGEPAAEEPAPEEPADEEPAAEAEPAPEEPADEDPAAEEPPAEEPPAKRPDLDALMVARALEEPREEEEEDPEARESLDALIAARAARSREAAAREAEPRVEDLEAEAG